MKLQTTVPISKCDFSIDYNSRILSMGSCFAENIGEKFAYYKFRTVVNPFGIIFNSVSLEKIIQRVVNRTYFKEKDIFFHNERWSCFEVHSGLSDSSSENLLVNLNRMIDETHSHIKELSHVVLTLGTAWVYRHIKTDVVVANCHKKPQQEFTKELLSSMEIQQNLVNIAAMILTVNPSVKFIVTVSPVRHIKDGFAENNVSKAHLLSAVYQFIKNEKVPAEYFPGYEIMMDELRDYRFYAADMLHPSVLAIQYIWERFGSFAISETCNWVMNEVEAIQKARQHRPFNPASEDYRKFQQNLCVRIEKLQKTYPFMDF